VVKIPAVATKRKEEDIAPTPLAKAHGLALAKTLLDLIKMNYPDKMVIDSFKKTVSELWKRKWMYYRDEPEFQELVKLGVLPPKP
jgi:hypothetical protein